MTTDVIPDLWPAIKVGVLSPIAILRNQAGRLASHTNGLLTADVRTSTDEDGQTHTFQIVAPSLKGYRYDLFSVRHGVEPFQYPVRIRFEPWQKQDLLSLNRSRMENFHLVGSRDEAEATASREAANMEMLLRMVGEVLGAPLTQSVIDSLIAKSNEVISPSAA